MAKPKYVLVSPDTGNEYPTDSAVVRSRMLARGYYEKKDTSGQPTRKPPVEQPQAAKPSEGPKPAA